MHTSAGQLKLICIFTFIIDIYINFSGELYTKIYLPNVLSLLCALDKGVLSRPAFKGTSINKSSALNSF